MCIQTDSAMAGAVVCVIAIKNLASFLGPYTSSLLQRRITTDLRLEGCKMLLNVDLSYHSNTRTGDITNRLGAESNRVAGAISNFVRLGMVILSVTVFVGLLVSISWQLTIGVVFLFSTIILLNQWFVRRSRVFGQELSKASREYSRGLLDMILGMSLVRTSASIPPDASLKRAYKIRWT